MSRMFVKSSGKTGFERQDNSVQKVGVTSVMFYDGLVFFYCEKRVFKAETTQKTGF